MLQDIPLDFPSTSCFMKLSIYPARKRLQNPTRSSQTKRSPTFRLFTHDSAHLRGPLKNIKVSICTWLSTNKLNSILAAPRRNSDGPDVTASSASSVAPTRPPQAEDAEPSRAALRKDGEDPHPVRSKMRREESLKIGRSNCWRLFLELEHLQGFSKGLCVGRQVAFFHLWLRCTSVEQ